MANNISSRTAHEYDGKAADFSFSLRMKKCAAEKHIAVDAIDT